MIQPSQKNITCSSSTCRTPHAAEGIPERKGHLSSYAGFIHPTDQRYEVRTVVERVNGRLKDDFGARHLRVRGHKKVYAHLMFGVIALCVDQIVRLLN